MRSLKKSQQRNWKGVNFNIYEKEWKKKSRVDPGATYSYFVFTDFISYWFFPSLFPSASHFLFSTFFALFWLDFVERSSVKVKRDEEERLWNKFFEMETEAARILCGYNFYLSHLPIIFLPFHFFLSLFLSSLLTAPLLLRIPLFLLPCLILFHHSSSQMM